MNNEVEFLVVSLRQIKRTFKQAWKEDSLEISCADFGGWFVNCERGNILDQVYVEVVNVSDSGIIVKISAAFLDEGIISDIQAKRLRQVDEYLVSKTSSVDSDNRKR